MLETKLKHLLVFFWFGVEMIRGQDGMEVIHLALGLVEYEKSLENFSS